MTIDKSGAGNWKYDPEIGKKKVSDLREKMKAIQEELLVGKAAHNIEARNSLAPDDKTLDNLLGHIRRLEKSNQELGLALHKCQHPEGAEGWD